MKFKILDHIRQVCIVKTVEPGAVFDEADDTQLGFKYLNQEEIPRNTGMLWAAVACFGGVLVPPCTKNAQGKISTLAVVRVTGELDTVEATSAAELFNNFPFLARNVMFPCDNVK